MKHFTPKFLEAYDRVLEVAKTKGEEAAKTSFRDEMLKLGHVERIHNLYRIQDKLTKKSRFFIPNKSQEKYLKQMKKRNIILKARQLGFTTLNCIRGLDLALFESNTRAGIMCHKQSVVKTIFTDITKFCYDWFLRDWSHLYNPKLNADSANSLSFEHDGLGRPLNSSLLVLFDFRGKTLHFLHVSEAARIDNDRLVGSMNGVPDNGEVTQESTAFGRGGEFFRQWNLHREKGVSAPYHGFFVPWFEHYPEEPEGWKAPNDVEWTEYEEGLLKGHSNKITPAHLMWRRWCIEAKCNGDPDIFENEYPTNDLDCFLSGAASVFPNSTLKMQDRNCKDPRFTGFLMRSGRGYDLHDDVHGIISIWEEPNPKSTYVMGADPSGGVGRDMAGAYVKNQQTGKYVARIYGNLEPKDFAKELEKVGIFYNKAFLCVEVNNHGHLVLDYLNTVGYGNLYKRQVVDEKTLKPTKKLGFLTTNEGKLTITEKFKTAAREGKVVITDKQLISEMSTFVQVGSKNGRTVKREAAQGMHDDLVMAASLTEEADSTRPMSEYDEDMEAAQRTERQIVDPETGFLIGEIDV